jgi:hypothetical protein
MDKDLQILKQPASFAHFSSQSHAAKNPNINTSLGLDSRLVNRTNCGIKFGREHQPIKATA